MEGLKRYSYWDILRILSLTTLETRFVRADLIEVTRFSMVWTAWIRGGFLFGMWV